MPLTKATQAVITPNIVTTDTTQTITGVKTISNDLTVNGITVGRGDGFISTNTAIGINALTANTTGSSDTAVGASALSSNTTGVSNTAVGSSAGRSTTIGSYNTSHGWSALYSNTTGNYNTAIGSDALRFNTGQQNTAIGAEALRANTTATGNTAVGNGALYSNTTGEGNDAFGVNALGDNTTGFYNSAFGAGSLTSVTNGEQNVAMGYSSALFVTTGDGNTAIGFNALTSVIGQNNNTAIGNNALAGSAFSNAGGFGNSSEVTGSNQVQLGNSATTTYAYGAVQDRSDIRDKADIRDTQLGLEFVNALRPVDFKWDMREDYRPEAPASVAKPVDLKDEATEEEKAKHAQELAAYNAYLVEKDKWLEDVKLANITHDGSKTRNRFHHGLIAQEVKAVLDSKGIDFGGFQDHKIAGGDDVLSIGYNELIAPMIKAIQELSAEVASLKAQLNS